MIPAGQGLPGKVAVSGNRVITSESSRTVLVIKGSEILPEPPTAHNRPSPLLYLVLVKQAQINLLPLVLLL